MLSGIQHGGYVEAASLTTHNNSYTRLHDYVFYVLNGCGMEHEVSDANPWGPLKEYEGTSDVRRSPHKNKWIAGPWHQVAKPPSPLRHARGVWKRCLICM